MPSLAQRIRKSRERLDISQQDLARRVGVHRQTVSAWETEEKDPRGANLYKLAKALGVPEPWLEFGDEHEVVPTPTDSPPDWATTLERLSAVVNWARTQPDWQHLRMLHPKDVARIREERHKIEAPPHERDPFMGPAMVMVEAALERSDTSLNAFRKAAATFSVYLELRKNPDAVTDVWVDALIRKHVTTGTEEPVLESNSANQQ